MNGMNLIDHDEQEQQQYNQSSHFNTPKSMKSIYDNMYPITGMNPSVSSSRLSEPNYLPHMGIPPPPTSSSSSFHDHMIYYDGENNNNNSNNNNNNMDDYFHHHHHPGYGPPPPQSMKQIRKKKSAHHQLSRSHSIGTTNPYLHEYYSNNNDIDNNEDDAHLYMYNMNLPPPPPSSFSHQQQEEYNDSIQQQHYFHSSTSVPNSPNLRYIPPPNENLLPNGGLRRSASMHEAFLPSDMPPSMINSNLPLPNLQRRHSLFEFDHQPSPDMILPGNSAPSTPWMAPMDLPPSLSQQPQPQQSQPPHFSFPPPPQQQQQSLDNPNMPLSTNIDFNSSQFPPPPPPPPPQQQQQQQQQQQNQQDQSPLQNNQQQNNSQQNNSQGQQQQSFNNDMMSSMTPQQQPSSFFSQPPNPMMHHQSMQPPPPTSMMGMPTPPNGATGMMGMHGLPPHMGNMHGGMGPPMNMNMMPPHLPPWDPMMMGGGRPPPFGFPGDPMNMMNPMGMGMMGPMMPNEPLSKDMMMNEKEMKKEEKKEKKDKEKKIEKSVTIKGDGAGSSLPIVKGNKDPLPPLAVAGAAAATAAAVAKEIKKEEKKEEKKAEKKAEAAEAAVAATAAAIAATGNPDLSTTDQPKLKRKSSIWNLFGGRGGGGFGYRSGGLPMDQMDYARRHIPMSFMQQPHMLDYDFRTRGMDNSKLNEKIEQFNRLPYVWCYVSPVNLSLTYWCAFKINNQRKLNHAFNHHERAVTLDKERALPGTVIVNPLTQTAVLYKSLWSTSKMILTIMRLSHEDYMQHTCSLSPHLMQKYAPKGPMFSNNGILKSFITDVAR
ncbi:unnamed protein product [Cunninghamella echinulata]